MTNDMITLVSKWENRLHPPNPSDKKNCSVWPTSFPNLLRLTKKEKTLNNEAMITYKRPTTVGQLLTNYRSLAHSEASNQQQRGYSGPCGHCALCGKFGKHDANMVPKVTALHSKGKLFPLRQVLTCANYGIYVATCKLCGEQYAGQTSNKFSKRWNFHRSSWDTVNLSNDQEQVPLLHHVVHEDKIEKKPKISECFIVTFVEQPSYDYLDICEDKWLNKISASINKHRIILPRIKWDLPLFRRCSCHHFCFAAPFFLLTFIALSSRCVF